MPCTLMGLVVTDLARWNVPCTADLHGSIFFLRIFVIFRDFIFFYMFVFCSPRGCSNWPTWWNFYIPCIADLQDAFFLSEVFKTKEMYGIFSASRPRIQFSPFTSVCLLKTDAGVYWKWNAPHFYLCKFPCISSIL